MRGFVVRIVEKNHEIFIAGSFVGKMQDGTFFPSGTGFVTPSLTFLRCLSFNQCKTFRRGQHAPSGYR
jgi:hypothetical protein